MIESYNLILMAQFRGYFDSENAESKEFREKVKFVDEKIKAVSRQQAEADQQRELIRALVQSKDNII